MSKFSFAHATNFTRALSSLDGSRLAHVVMKVLPDPVSAYLRDVRAIIADRTVDDMPPRPKWETVLFAETATVPVKLLIGTSSGLLYYEHGRLHRILDGYFYGITRHRDRWYAFTQRSGRYPGRIISFHLDRSGIGDVRNELVCLGPWVHQIHACNGSLYVADTRNNRLIRFVIGSDGLKREQHFYANGWLRKNETHLNSIYCRNDEIYLIYHNRTRYTGRNSQIAVLNNTLQLNRVIQTQAGSAHNIAVLEDALIYCDSAAGTLVWKEPVLRVDCFTRGLAISDQFAFVGGTKFEERKDREHKQGYVFAFDIKARKLNAQISIPMIGRVLELRLIEPSDHAMTGHNHSLEQEASGNRCHDTHKN